MLLKKGTNFCLSKSAILQEGILQIAERHKTVVVITDENIARLYGDEMCDLLQKACVRTSLVAVPPGEASKSREMKAFLEDELLQFHVDKESAIVAFGGGVIGDLAGFTAATYMRGLDYYMIPTSLMAMVDASIGGKTAVNTPKGKNLIGLIHFPKAIFVESRFLETLPEEELKSGFIEVIKYGLIWDRELFAKIERGEEEEIIGRSIAIKEEIVAKDPYERGLRRVLNFGHTVGHGIEQVSNYSISHGKAVYMGLMVESFICHSKGLLPKSELEAIVALLQRQNMNISQRFDKKTLYEVMRHDKKSRKTLPRMAAISKIGTVCEFNGTYSVEISELELGTALNEIYG